MTGCNDRSRQVARRVEPAVRRAAGRRGVTPGKIAALERRLSRRYGVEVRVVCAWDRRAVVTTRIDGEDIRGLLPAVELPVPGSPEDLAELDRIRADRALAHVCRPRRSVPRRLRPAARRRVGGGSLGLDGGLGAPRAAPVPTTMVEANLANPVLASSGWPLREGGRRDGAAPRLLRGSEDARGASGRSVALHVPVRRRGPRVARCRLGTLPCLRCLAAEGRERRGLGPRHLPGRLSTGPGPVSPRPPLQGGSNPSMRYLRRRQPWSSSWSL